MELFHVVHNKVQKNGFFSVCFKPPTDTAFIYHTDYIGEIWIKKNLSQIIVSKFATNCKKISWFPRKLKKKTMKIFQTTGYFFEILFWIQTKKRNCNKEKILLFRFFLLRSNNVTFFWWEKINETFVYQ